LSRKEQRRLEAEQRKRLQPLKSQVDLLEKQLEKLHEQRDEMTRQLTDPTLYDEGDKDRISTLMRQKAGIDDEVDRIENAWMEAAEAYEEAWRKPG
jgi:ATP-binding cassette subfamily F protein 3